MLRLVIVNGIFYYVKVYTVALELLHACGQCLVLLFVAISVFSECLYLDYTLTNWNK